MIKILVLEDDVKLNQVVSTYLNDSGFHVNGCLNAAVCWSLSGQTCFPTQ
ncbi:MAG: hypothetical protein ACI4EG_02345 [Fusicatenibacter sp.]